MALHYLTIQDILWINRKVTNKVNDFDYSRLEEATFYQYAYGESNSLLPQAERFVTGFLRMAPFNEGNERTALVACAAFLRLNGFALSVPPANVDDWLKQAAAAKPSLAGQVSSAPDGEHFGPREAISAVIADLSVSADVPAASA